MAPPSLGYGLKCHHLPVYSHQNLAWHTHSIPSPVLNRQLVPPPVCPGQEHWLYLALATGLVQAFNSRSWNWAPLVLSYQWGLTCGSSPLSSVCGCKWLCLVTLPPFFFLRSPVKWKIVTSFCRNQSRWQCSLIPSALSGESPTERNALTHRPRSVPLTCESMFNIKFSSMLISLKYVSSVSIIVDLLCVVLLSNVSLVCLKKA